jgi:hypothetical protein
VSEQGPSPSLLLALLLVYSLAGAAMYSSLFAWQLPSALYFVLSSLSTVGFGDIVPEDSVVFLLTGGYVLLGLALYSLWQVGLQAVPAAPRAPPPSAWSRAWTGRWPGSRPGCRSRSRTSSEPTNSDAVYILVCDPIRVALALPVWPVWSDSAEGDYGHDALRGYWQWPLGQCGQDPKLHSVVKKLLLTS